MPPTYRPRAWHLVIVALIALFDLLVLYMVLFPDVSDDYRAYYIDRTASCFPRVTSGFYPLGEPVSFVPGRSGYKLDTIRWCGFMPPNNTGIRSFGDYGVLKIRTPLPDDDLLLTFSSWANTDSNKPRRDVDVVVNGEKIGTLSFASAKRVNGSFVIPQRVAKLAGLDARGNDVLEIKFVVPRIGPPGTNSEPVTLQLRLEAMRLVPLGNAIAPASPQQRKEAELTPASSQSPG
ncbi:MAG TPA: hypothetical protein VHA07_06830 [Devosia sp.]|nr:hypothetical protein [Devosia sp.]